MLTSCRPVRANQAGMRMIVFDGGMVEPWADLNPARYLSRCVKEPQYGEA